MAPSMLQPVEPICTSRLPICDTQPRLPEPATCCAATAKPLTCGRTIFARPAAVLDTQPLGQLGSPCSCAICCSADDSMPVVWQLQHAGMVAPSCQQCMSASHNPACPLTRPVLSSLNSPAGKPKLTTALLLMQCCWSPFRTIVACIA